MAEIYTGNFIEKDMKYSTSYSISYKEIMQDIGLYSTSIHPSEEEEEINQRIESTTSFNAVVYAYVTTRNGGFIREYYINPQNYKYFLINDIDISNASQYKSIAYYDISKLTININEDHISELVDPEKSVPGKVTTEIGKEGDMHIYEAPIYLYITAEVLEKNDNGEYITTYYPIAYRVNWHFKYSPKDMRPPEEIPEDIPEDDSIPGGGGGTNPDIDNPVSPGINGLDTTLEISISELDVPDEYRKYIYLNSISVEEWKTKPMLQPSSILHEDPTSDDIHLITKDAILRLHFNEKCSVPISITMNATDSLSNSHKHTFKYTPVMTEVSGNEYERVQKMNTPNVSYGLLRVNPKLTGNIKVVIDENSNIYLDTFKVSKSLEQKRFRHVKVNANEYYGQTLMARYKDIPTTDFYKVEDKCYNLFTTAQTYNSQYYDLYRYGVKTNNDNMYSENFALLAPLCIKEVMPDFFLVFKVDTTASNYDESWEDTEKMRYFIKYGKVIKSYDMRKDSVLGEYIRTIYERSKEYPGDAYISYSSTNHNRYIGISVERGVVASAYESPFDEEGVKSQVAMNDFYTEGFERNRLVSKNIINFEFMFNDTESELFSIDTYFGLYVKLNGEAEEFSCIGNDSYEINTVDENGNPIEGTLVNNYVFDTSVHTFPENTNLTDSSIYKNFIYGLSTPTEFIRLNSGLHDAPEIDKYILKPYKNILSEEVRKTEIGNFKSYLIFTLHNLLEIGDHIRVIDIKNNTIYEIVTTNTYDYHDGNGISDVTTCYSRTNSSFYTIKYISIVISSRKETEALVNKEGTENPTLEYLIESQATQLFNAFKKFNVPEIFSSYKQEGATISLLGNVDTLIFERICSPSGFTEEQKIYLEEDDSENNTIEFFNNVYPEKLILDVEDISWKYSKYVYLYPLHFEVVGNRMAHACAFVKLSSFNDKYLYSLTIPSSDVFDYKTTIYSAFDSEGNIINKKYENIKITSFTVDENVISQTTTEVKYIPSFVDSNKVILNISNPYLRNNVFSLYNSYPLNSGICSIFNIKDFDFSVLDAESYISIANIESSIGNPGEFNNTSIFNTSEYETEEDILNYKEEVDSNGFTTYYHTEGYNFKIYQGQLKKKDNSTDSKIYYIFLDENEDKNTLKYDIADLVLHQPKLVNDDNIDIVDYSIPTADYVFSYKILNSPIIINFLNRFINLEEDSSYGPDSSRIGVIGDGDQPSSYDLTTEITYYLKGDAYAEHTPVTTSIQEFIYNWNSVDKHRTAKGILEIEHLTFLQDFVYGIGGWVASGIVTGSPGFKTSVGYSQKPIRNTSEENVKDYIDKYRSFYTIEKEPVNLSDKNNVSKYFNNLFENNHTKSDISFVSPYVCKWKGIGTDARGESLRVMHDFLYINEDTGYMNSMLVDSSSYFVSGSNTYSSYLGYLYYKNTGNSDEDTSSDNDYLKYNKYIGTSLNNLALPTSPTSDIIGVTEKEYILDGNGTLEDILYNSTNSNNRFSVAYNAGEDTLEFISSGVKFRIKTNNSDAINLSSYNGYSAIFVSLPDVNKDYARQTELIIDETRKEIMLVWYQSTNTFKFGVKYEPIPNNYDLFGAIFNRYMYRVYHEDDIINAQCSFNGSYRTLIVADDTDYGNKIGYTYTTDEGEEKTLRGIRLCKAYGAMWIGSVVTDNSKYSKYNRVALTGILHPAYPEREYPSDYTYSYYMKKNNLTLVEPYFWHNYDAVMASNGDIDMYAYNYSPSIESFISTDDPAAIPNTVGTFSDLKKAVSSCAIYIKTTEGKKDYTTYNNLLNINVIEPIVYYKHEGLGKTGTRIDKKKEIALGYVHPSYIEPVTKDIFNFKYSNLINADEIENVVTIESIFEKSFDGANIVLNKVNTVDQIWFNKYTEEFNYCIKQAENTESDTIYKTKTSLDVKHNVSVMSDSWNSKLYRNYFVVTDEETGQDIEHFEYVPGYKTGYELKTFIHSRGINLNGSDGNTVEITSWKNTELSQKNKYIKLDITDSLVYNILFRDSFKKYWNYLSLTDNTYKINYIKNTILPLININNKTKFVLYKSDKLLKLLKFNSELNENDCTEISNYKNELKYENGKYYMYVYPEDISVYYAKMIIDL